VCPLCIDFNRFTVLKKGEDKQYVRFSGYPGGQRFRSATEMMKKKPTAMVEIAVKGMLPKNKLANQLYRNLHVYAGAEHKHEGQQPKAYELKG
jgi:large subunit ribosomal protein L13